MATGDTFAGLVIGVSTSAPATYDTAGFNALTYTTVGGAISPGDLGSDYNSVETKVLDERGTVVTKGTRNSSQFQMNVLLDHSDAGQIILLAGAEGAEVDTNHSFQLTYTNGDVYHFQALIGSFNEIGGDADVNRTVQVNLFVDVKGTVRS